MLRCFILYFSLCTAKILPTHRVSVFETSSRVEPPIFGCQGLGVSWSVEVPSFLALPFTLTHQVAHQHQYTTLKTLDL
jgi:hypothetical protein